jgi:RNA recognition motif-containing protein
MFLLLNVKIEEEEIDDDERPNKKQNTGKRQRTRPKAQKIKISAPNVSSVNEPNKILFLENLPEDIHAQPQLVELLFQKYALFSCQTLTFISYPGYKEVRLIPGKGIGFVEYDTEFNAATSMTALQGFKVLKSAMKITFAKK